MAVRLIGKCARAWNLGTRFPGALRAKRSDLTGFLIFEPVLQYDPNDTALYQMQWRDGNRVAAINLLELLRPRNLDVPKGYVAEMDVSLEELNGMRYLVIHSADIKLRDTREITPQEERDLLTARDEDLTDDGDDQAAAART